ncbi:hypothetical protein B0I35DRAFT_74718 [Stachybotrys elegans]|uniref:Heterokaryon incompatibility domain-containing protein n=1 Tax=Stachybotrys elegans TaxID=80388 RepID=A0A8K0WME8_9HYPO|nr:hypothetical protein B0I35DRAFT_74718 [Stachybotrys elegans]
MPHRVSPGPLQPINLIPSGDGGFVIDLTSDGQDPTPPPPDNSIDPYQVETENVRLCHKCERLFVGDLVRVSDSLNALKALVKHHAGNEHIFHKVEDYYVKAEILRPNPIGGLWHNIRDLKETCKRCTYCALVVDQARVKNTRVLPAQMHGDIDEGSVYALPVIRELPISEGRYEISFIVIQKRHDLRGPPFEFVEFIQIGNLITVDPAQDRNDDWASSLTWLRAANRRTTIQRLQNWLALPAYFSFHVDYVPSVPKRLVKVMRRGSEFITRVVTEFGNLEHILRRDNDIYATLSYKLAPIPMPQLTTENLARYQDDVPSNQFPRCFQRIFELMTTLGIKYVWIYPLCVLQDDSSDQDEAFASLFQTFHHAQVNFFVPFAGRSKRTPYPTGQISMLREPCLVSHAWFDRNTNEPIAHPHGCHRIVDNEGLSHMVGDSDMWNHIWPFVEHFVSRNILYIAKDQI